MWIEVGDYSLVAYIELYFRLNCDGHIVLTWKCETI